MKPRIFPVLLFAGFAVFSGFSEELDIHSPEYMQSAHSNGLFLVSPMIGWNENTIEDRVTGKDVTDGGWEYGLFSLYATPRFAANNMLFFTSANSADVWGDFLFLNFYGDPEASVTWNLGAGHLWHRISTDDPFAKLDVDVYVPLVKAGVLVRIKPLNITLNPYLAYSWENTYTEGNVYQGPFLGWQPVDTSCHTESVLYGLTCKWHWRMAHLTAKYYLEDNLDLNEYYHVARVRGTFMFNRDIGITARVEYMEHSTSEDLSVLVGPTFLF